MTDEEKDAALARFTAMFPEFESAGYSCSRIGAALDTAFAAIGEKRFGKQTEYGRFLYAAHFLSVMGSGTRGDGTASGGAVGAIAGKSVGGASVSYDTGSTSDSEAGWFNATMYGKALWHLYKSYRRLPIVVSGRAFPT